MKKFRPIPAVIVVLALCLATAGNAFGSDAKTTNPEAHGNSDDLVLELTPAFCMSENDEVSEVLPIDNRPTVDADKVNAIFAAHRNQVDINTPRSSELTEVSAHDLEEELSHIYLEIESAKLQFEEAPTNENKAIVENLESRLSMIKLELESRGYIFLSPEEAAIIMGESTSSEVELTDVDTRPIPSDTSNTDYVASTLRSTTLSDGRTINYFYVLAYAKSVNSNLYSDVVVTKPVDKFANLVDALFEIYTYKVIAWAISSVEQISFLQWVPYELFSTDLDNVADVAAECRLEAQYTTTTKFIWSYSEIGNTYILDGALNRTDIDEVRKVRGTQSGNNYSYTADEAHYMFYPNNYYNEDYVVRYQWENSMPTVFLEYIGHRDHYYKETDNSPLEYLGRTEIPYAERYYDLN